MRTRYLVLAAALTLSANAAFAVTKYQGSVVPVTLGPVPGTPNTLQNKSLFKLAGTGAVQVKMKGVTDGTGALATTSQIAPATDPAVTYVGVIHGQAVGVAFSLNILVALKKGAGVTNANLGPLLTLTTPGAPIALTGADYFTPVPNVGTNIADCNAVLTGVVPGVWLDALGPNPCASGILLGVGGVAAGL